MAFIPPIGSTVAFQSDPTKLVGTVSIVGNMNSSITAFQGGAWITSVVNIVPSSLLVGASIIGTVPVTGNVFINGSVATVGSVTALQGTNPWITVPTSGSIIATQLANSVMGVRTDNASVVAVLANSSVAVLQGTNPWQVNVPTPSYFTFQTAGSVLQTISRQAAGSILAVRTDNASVVAVLATSSVAVLQGTNPWIVNVPTPSLLSIQPGGSVMNVAISGSVAAAVTNFTASVAANINVISASIITNQGTNPWVVGSIVGTYAEDAAAGTTDKGIFVLGVRNDTMSSVTNADGDYGSFTVGPVGENIVANSPITKWVSGATSVMSGTSVQVLAAPGASIFTYITGINVINESATLSRVTITQGRGAVPASMLTWAIAPATGGSNATFINPIRVLDNNGVSASISGVSSVYVTITGFTAKT